MVEFEGVEIGEIDVIGKRIITAISTSGSIPSHWDEVTVEEAWRFGAGGVAEWSDFVNDRSLFPGGLIERQIKDRTSHKLVAVAFLGIKDLDRPDGWKKGVIGMKGGGILLGNFPNKI